jgi:VanZ family protein
VDGSQRGLWEIFYIILKPIAKRYMGTNDKDKQKPGITPDKWRHFYVGIPMGIVLQAFLTWLIPDHFWLASLLAFIMVIAISYGFELFSKFTGKGHYEVMDAVAGVIGGAVGMGATIFIQLIL